MSQRVRENRHTLSVVAIAAAAIVLYSLWGASLLSAERSSQASGMPQTQLAAR